MINDIINKTYYAYVDTSTIFGKLEQKVLEILNLTIYKHGKNGKFFIDNKEVFTDTIYKIKWRYDNRNKNKLQYDFYLKMFNKYIHLGKLRYDKLYIDKDFNIRGKGYIFNRHMFDFNLYTEPKP
jgi:hypothetical protein